MDEHNEMDDTGCPKPNDYVFSRWCSSPYWIRKFFMWVGIMPARVKRLKENDEL